MNIGKKFLENLERSTGKTFEQIISADPKPQKTLFPNLNSHKYSDAKKILKKYKKLPSEYDPSEYYDFCKPVPMEIIDARLTIICHKNILSKLYPLIQSSKIKINCYKNKKKTA